MREATEQERQGVNEYIRSISQRVYTKNEVIAILKELQLDIEKHTMTSGVTNQGTWNECIACCSRVIQQKINALKGE